MKNVIFNIIAAMLISLPLCAQVKNHHLHLQSVTSYKIQVTDKATTVVLFPYSVLDADRGTDDLYAEKIPGMTNAIKIKAASNQMEPTNLHVFTADGKIYDFKISYHPNPTITTYALKNNNDPLSANPVKFSSAINEKELSETVNKVRHEKAFLHRSKRRFELKVSLRGVYIHKDMLLFKFFVRNHSGLSYKAGWSSLYLNDKKTAKRSSAQQLPITPLHTDPLPDINSNDQQEWIMVIPKITIADKKELTFELQEKNGGRHIKITIRNKELLKAKTI